jgi:methylmalonyl-CoA mutase N-terminal domain/subunit
MKPVNTDPSVPQQPTYVNEFGMVVAPYYTGVDLERIGFREEVAAPPPGQFPFTRGTRAAVPRDHPPLNAVYSGFGLAEDSNDRYKKVLGWGANALAIAADLPTQLGLDSDHSLAYGEVGRVGVAIDSLQDMELLFRDIPLNSLATVQLLGNSIGPIALALFIALGERQGLKVDEYVVELQNDVLKEYVARGTQIIPVRPAVKLVVDVVEWCSQSCRHWKPLTICANHMEVAGAGSAAANAFAMANATSYIDELLTRGARPEDVLPLLSLFVNERLDFFLAIANCRACRRMWARLLSDRYGIQDEDALKLRLTSYAHGKETLREPENNAVRIAFGALAAYLGGVQYLCVASYDEALNLPSEEAVRRAIRTHQLITFEHGLAVTQDPLGGSYYLETLTTQLEEKMRENFDRVMELGGAIPAIESGHYSKVITDGAARRQRDMELGVSKSVGVNVFVDSAESIPPATFAVPEELEQRQCRRLRELRRARDNRHVMQCLQSVGSAVGREANVVPTVLEAVRAYATVGEIADVFRQAYGEWIPNRTF